MHVQQRRKRGCPSKKPSELGDAGEARCRARLELQAQYKVPQVQKFVFVTGPIHVDIVLEVQNANVSYAERVISEAFRLSLSFLAASP